MDSASVCVEDTKSVAPMVDGDLTILGMRQHDPAERRTQDKPALSPDDIATELDVSVASVYRWISAGYIKAIRVGPKLFRIRREDYNAFIEAGGVPSPPKEGGKAK